MTVAFSPRGWEDYVYWQANDIEIVEKINSLVKEISRDPFRGIGKPEPLKGDFAGYWSRRINSEHRIVYQVRGNRPDQILIIAQARLHY
jgi:toxin YoeB